jgi:hypothetical protein
MSLETVRGEGAEGRVREKRTQEKEGGGCKWCLRLFFLEEEWQQRSQRDRARAGRQRERPSRR